MDPKYREKLRGLSVGAVGGEDAYQEMLRKKGKLVEPIDTSVDPATSQRFRDVQKQLVQEGRKFGTPDERTDYIKSLPPGLTETETDLMLQELMSDEVQPPVQYEPEPMPSRFNKLKSKFQK